MLLIILVHLIVEDETLAKFDQLDFDVDWFIASLVVTLYFVFAVFSYLIMFYIFMKSRSTATNQRNVSALYAFRSSR